MLQHGWGNVIASYRALSRASARPRERFRRLSCPHTCSSTAGGTLLRVIVTSHVLQHDRGNVFASYRAPTHASAWPRERFRELSCTHTCFGTAGGSFLRVIVTSHVLQHGPGNVFAGYRALSCAPARPEKRFCGLSCPHACFSTAQGTFLRVIVPSHVLQHGRRNVITVYRALTHVSAHPGERYCGLSCPHACSSTAGETFLRVIVPPHLLQHGLRNVIAGFRALTHAQAWLEERYCELSCPHTCSSTAGGTFGTFFVPSHVLFASPHA